MEKTHAAVTGTGSALSKYQDVMIGERSLSTLLYFEWCMLLGPIPGAIGMVLRKIFWPRMFRECGKGCMFGAGIVVRQPGKITLGTSVIISEGCILDGRSSTSDNTVILGDNVILSNGVMLSCKEGHIAIGNDVGINAQSIIQSTNNCPVNIGDDCIIGQRALVVGGGSYNTDRLEVPIRMQGIRPDGGVTLQDNVWLGANVSVLGGVTMGSGSIAGTSAVVTKSIPGNAVCLGSPAKVVRFRTP